MATDPAVQAAARAFHEAYERLAPDFGYKTREDSAVPWEQVPEANKALMIATVAAVTPLIRAQAFTEAADAIQATVYYVYPPPEGEARARLDGLRKARDEAAVLVRGLGEETENA